MALINTFTVLCSHHHYTFPEHSHQPKQAITLHTSLPPHLMQPLFYFLSLWYCQFQAPHASDIIQYWFLCFWLISLSIIISKSSRVLIFILLIRNEVEHFSYVYEPFIFPIRTLCSIICIFSYWIIGHYLMDL